MTRCDVFGRDVNGNLVMKDGTDISAKSDKTREMLTKDNKCYGYGLKNTGAE